MEIRAEAYNWRANIPAGFAVRPVLVVGILWLVGFWVMRVDSIKLAPMNFGGGEWVSNLSTWKRNISPVI